VVLYGYEDRFLTLREEHRLKGFEKRVLRRIFGPKRDEVTGWRWQHIEELHNSSTQPSIIIMKMSRRMGCEGIVERMMEKRMHIEYREESHREKDSVEDQDVDGCTILHFILELRG
jgi:hypothetical protein